MKYRAELLHSDLKDAQQYGIYLSKPSNQLVRLISLFSEEHRLSFVKDAHCFLEGEPPRSSLEQFASQFVLEDALGEELSPADKNWHALCELSHMASTEGAHVIRFGQLPRYVRERVSRVVSGANHGDIALILANTLLYHDLTRNEELTQLISRTMRDRILSAEQAAALVSAVEANSDDIRRFEGTAEYLIDEARFLPDECFSSKRERSILRDEAKGLKSILKTGHEAREAVLDEQHRLADVDELCRSHRLVPSPTGLFVPLRSHILVAKSIAEAEHMARDSRDLVLAMSGREFEEFMADIFDNLGFDVELTKATRDGGADLICMRSIHGIPFRLAVEVKRYRQKPIDVRFIRSFVGANEQWRANRLLYITTSRYTVGAHDFADRYAAHILTLKDYHQIVEWCKEVRQQRTTLL